MSSLGLTWIQSIRVAQGGEAQVPVGMQTLVLGESMREE